jgi:hypothetical protein
MGLHIVRHGIKHIKAAHGIKPKVGGVIVPEFKTPLHSGTYWPHVGKVVKANLHARFAHHPKAKELVHEFMTKHGEGMFGVGHNKLLAKTAKHSEPLMLKHIVKPVLHAQAKAYNVPMSHLTPLLEGPLNIPVGHGFLGIIHKILHNPLTKKVVGTVAKVILPDAAKTFQDYVTKKTGVSIPFEEAARELVKIENRNANNPYYIPSSAVPSESAAPAVPTPIPTPEAPLSHPEHAETMSTASGLGGAGTADQYHCKGGRYAMAVYEHAKKMA